MELFRQLESAADLFLIAGPCVVEDDRVMDDIARELCLIRDSLGIPVIFKASYQKANRSSADSYAGPGREAGLRSLARIGKEFGLPLLTDVHEQAEVAEAAEVCDVLQIPALLSRQTGLISAAGRTGRIVNLKKGQFMAPEDLRLAVAKTGANRQVLVTERGTCFGYHNLVVDFRSFAELGQLGLPVVFDVTHSLQLPGSGITSGGSPGHAGMMAKAAVATGFVRGLFLEVHPRPEQSRSDAASVLALPRLRPLMEACLRIQTAL